MRYVVPWAESDVMSEESVDMIVSQAVLEYVDNLEETYQAMHKWLRPNGIASHQIDFSAHQTCERWNGHWMYSDLSWSVMRGRRPYFLNREPHSTHIRMLKECGFEILCDVRSLCPTEVNAGRLAARFKDLPAEDLVTRGCFIQVEKRARG